jgi:hypothetical protein
MMMEEGLPAVRGNAHTCFYARSDGHVKRRAPAQFLKVPAAARLAV